MQLHYLNIARPLVSPKVFKDVASIFSFPYSSVRVKIRTGLDIAETCSPHRLVTTCHTVSAHKISSRLKILPQTIASDVFYIPEGRNVPV